jgi:hypothetical protein
MPGLHPRTRPLNQDNANNQTIATEGAAGYANGITINDNIVFTSNNGNGTSYNGLGVLDSDHVHASQ